jgi:hypothetical protein
MGGKRGNATADPLGAVRFWRKRRLLRLPVPLTGCGGLQSEQCWERDQWLPAFFRALEREAADGLDLLTTLERAWVRRTQRRRRPAQGLA